jgi:FtsP/CotA-like multicopper oxidase with cupredoxin domain
MNTNKLLTLLSLAGAALWGASQAGAQTAPILTPGVDYSFPNFAYTGPIRKFVDKLPGLTPGGANGIGQYIPLAVHNTPYGAPYGPNCDYYEIGLVEYIEKMHMDLAPLGAAAGTVTLSSGVITAIAVASPGAGYVQPLVVITDSAGSGASVTAVLTGGQVTGFTVNSGGTGYVNPVVTVTDLAKGTKLRGYVQIVPETWPGRIPLTIANGCSMDVKNGAGQQMYGADRPHYLGPLIIATKNVPVRLKLMNLLPTGTAGKLFLPVDTTIMGAGDGPKQIGTDGNGMPIYEKYTENRAVIHLHGGLPPWISDGTAHQWIAPAGEVTSYKKGVGAIDAPDMPPLDQDGVMTYYWPNEMSGRLMFYHDHTYGLTGPNVYAGEAAAYIVVDNVEETALKTAGVPGTIDTSPTTGDIINIEPHDVPIVIQDKTFVYGGLSAGATATATVGTDNATATAAMGVTATATATIDVNGVITGITVVNPGYGYLASPLQPTVTITDSGGGSLAAATAIVGAGGVISSITVDQGGLGYVTPVVTIDASPMLGKVNSITVVNSGSRYLAPPTVTIADTPPGSGSGATATATLGAGGSIARITVVNPGANFSAPVVTIGPSSLGVTAINVVNAGSGYAVPPTVTITDSTGTGATAGTVTLNGSGGIASIAVATAGSGYSATPVVTITASVGTGAVDPNWFTDIRDGMTGAAPTEGNLWYPHVYVPNQWPEGPDGWNPLGRWAYGPWFWPPWPVPTGVTPPLVSHTPEGFMDTIMVNGQPYPYLNVDPVKYRFRILNACNDRMVNLQLYKATPGIITNIVVTGGGSGYNPDEPPLVFISGGGGRGALASAVVDGDPLSVTFGQVTAITLDVVGSGYSTVPTVTIDPSPTGIPVNNAAATAQIYTLPTEVGMVPAILNAHISFPAGWRAQTPGFTPDILDMRGGGVPDPANRGPAFVQIGHEGGLLPGPAVLPNTPVGYERFGGNIVINSVKQKTLFLAPAERADVVVDFSRFAGQTVILYNDSPAPVPAGDTRYDFYTGGLDNTGSGGAPPTLAGMGPSTRTIMAFKVSGTKGVTTPDYVDPALLAALTTTLPALFASEQPAPVVPQMAYNSAYPAAPAVTNVFSHIQSTSLSFVPYGASTPVTMQMISKTIQELFDDVGRLNATLGTELPFTTAQIQTTVPLNFVDPATEIFNDGETQIWKITHNGVDTHGIHFHLFNVQLINRVGWDGLITPPNANELGWKDTVRMNPLEDIIVAMRAVKPSVPFGVVPSIRLLSPAVPPGSRLGFSNLDPLTGNGFVPAVSNVVANFGWEYAWHCHILGHEENDMMRPVVMNVQEFAPTPAPSTLTATLITTPTLQVNLAWVDTTANEVGFRIMRQVDGGAFETAGVVGANSTSFIDRDVTTDHTYTYEVIAYNSAANSSYVGGPPGESPPSNQASVGTTLGQPTPTSLTATASALSTAAPTITVTFKDNSPADNGFTLQRATDAIFTTALATFNLPVQAGMGTVSYLDTGVGLATTYYYRVRAEGAPTFSAWSVSASATTPGRLPVAPSNVRLGGATRTSMLVRWNDNSNNETGFLVYRAPDPAVGPWTLVTTTAANATSFTITGLTRNNTYFIKVVALNAYGQSTPAVSLALKTLP